MVLEHKVPVHMALGKQGLDDKQVAGSKHGELGKVLGSTFLVGMVVGMDEHMVLGMQDDKVILVVYNIYRRCRRP